MSLNSHSLVVDAFLESLQKLVLPLMNVDELLEVLGCFDLVSHRCLLLRDRLQNELSFALFCPFFPLSLCFLLGPLADVVSEFLVLGFFLHVVVEQSPPVEVFSEVDLVFVVPEVRHDLHALYLFFDARQLSEFMGA